MQGISIIVKHGIHLIWKCHQLSNKEPSNGFIVGIRSVYKSSKVNGAISQMWAQDLGVEIYEYTGTVIWEYTNSISMCNRARELLLPLDIASSQE